MLRYRGIHIATTYAPGRGKLPPRKTAERKQVAAAQPSADFSRVVVAAPWRKTGVATTLVNAVATRLHSAACVAMFPGELGVFDPKGWVRYDDGKSKAYVWSSPCRGLYGGWYGFDGNRAWAPAPAPEPSAGAELLLAAPAPGVAPSGYCPACAEHKEVG